MPMATIHKAGEGNLYHIHFLDQRVDPGFGGGTVGGGVDPGYGHPEGGRPSHGLPGGRPGIPSNDLPSTPPPELLPGHTLVMIRTQDGKWHYAAIMPGSPPPRPLPEPPQPGHPDQGLPGQPARPDQGLPSQPGHPSQPIAGQPVRPDNTLPPYAEPKR